jgi:hypothetical protein
MSGQASIALSAVGWSHETETVTVSRDPTQTNAAHEPRPILLTVQRTPVTTGDDS